MDGEQQKSEGVGGDEQSQRIRAQPDEGRGPTLPPAPIDRPDAYSQRGRGQSAHEDRVRGGPEILVDGEYEIPDEAADSGEPAPRQKAGDFPVERPVGQEESPGENTEKRRRDRGQGGEKPLGVPVGIVLPGVVSEDEPVDVRREVSLDVQPSGSVAGHRDAGHQQPVPEQESRGHGKDASAAEREVDESREEIADGDSLEDSGNSD